MTVRADGSTQQIRNAFPQIDNATNTYQKLNRLTNAQLKK